jgi:NhaP-type Na+/H+ or K+/H+ antiporter
MRALLFGEGVVNDAVSILIFRAILINPFIFPEAPESNGGNI